MAASANTKQYKVNTAGIQYISLKLVTMLVYLGTRDIASEDVDLRPGDVHLVEEVLIHEQVIALQRIGVHREVFVEVEGNDVGEVESFISVFVDQAFVNTNGC